MAKANEQAAGISYGFGVTLDAPFDEAAARVKDALKAQGFGVLTEIDVQKTLREKLGEEMEPYLILGACNPPLAHRALSVEREIGLLLPCNVVVRTVDGKTRVEVADPIGMLGIVGSDTLNEVASDAKQRLERAVEALRAERQEA